MKLKKCKNVQLKYSVIAQLKKKKKTTKKLKWSNFFEIKSPVIRTLSLNQTAFKEPNYSTLCN